MSLYSAEADRESYTAVQSERCYNPNSRCVDEYYSVVCESVIYARAEIHSEYLTPVTQHDRNGT